MNLKVNLKFVISFCLLLLALLLVWMFIPKPKQQPRQKLSFEGIVPCKDCNLIIISIDPLRTENMSLYGYSRKTTPQIDKLGDESYVFNNFVSVSPWTLPAHMSLFTGVYPSRHKITNKVGLTPDQKEFDNNLQKVSPNIKTLAGLLKENGYTTAGFTGGAADAGQFGFSEGFDEYTDSGDFAGLDDNLPKATAWINKNKEGKFFLFLQGYDVHGQFVPAGGYDKRFVDFEYKGSLTGSKEEQKDLREEGITRGKVFLTQDDVRFYTDLYDEKVQRMDEKIGKFLSEVKNAGLWDKTVIIFTSGHGDEFYEHGRVDHGHSLYEELVHVPLIMKIPGNKNKIVLNQQFSIVDIMPTVFDILGSPNLKDSTVKLDGHSIVDSLENGTEDKNVYLETDYRYSVFLRGIRTDDNWKIIKNLETGQMQLFNLNNDRLEKVNLADKDTTKLKQLNEVLDSQIKNF